jgi:hypothetical protein
MEEQALVEGLEVRAGLVVPAAQGGRVVLVVLADRAAAADPVPAALEILPTHARR